MEKIRLVLSTFPNTDEARRIATLAIEKQMAACVNLIPTVESIYRWDGKVETATEVLAIFKTTASAYPAFASWLKETHSYGTPEIIALNPTNVDSTYAIWLSENTHPN